MEFYMFLYYRWQWFGRPRKMQSRFFQAHQQKPSLFDTIISLKLQEAHARSTWCQRHAVGDSHAQWSRICRRQGRWVQVCSGASGCRCSTQIRSRTKWSALRASPRICDVSATTTPIRRWIAVSLHSQKQRSAKRIRNPRHSGRHSLWCLRKPILSSAISPLRQMSGWQSPWPSLFCCMYCDQNFPDFTRLLLSYNYRMFLIGSDLLG